MKGISIGAPESRSGKTTISIGIVRALKNRGIDIRAGKVGPDFIDTKYLSIASSHMAQNFDRHMMGESGIRKAVDEGELLIVEGVMGYFDGRGKDTFGSTYDISEILNIPSVIVYYPKGESLTSIVKLKGMADFSKGRIKGVIFNKVSEKYYLMLKEMLEEYTDIKVLGFIPKDESFQINEEKLGLSIMNEAHMERYIESLANVIEENIDLDGIIEMAKEVKREEYPAIENLNLKIVIAYDEAFCFLYRDNLRILEKMGEVEYFSPLRDEKIPDCNLLYLIGGYQMDYREELSHNKKMMETIRRYSDEGGKIFAEGGGFEYLLSEMEDSKMVGIFKGRAERTPRLTRFGYHTLKLNKDTYFAKKDTLLPSQEYHKTVLLDMGDGIMEVFKNDNLIGTDGYLYNNTFGMENHINFLGCVDLS